MNDLMLLSFLPAFILLVASPESKWVAWFCGWLGLMSLSSSLCCPGAASEATGSTR